MENVEEAMPGGLWTEMAASATSIKAAENGTANGHTDHGTTNGDTNPTESEPALKKSRTCENGNGDQVTSS